MAVFSVSGKDIKVTYLPPALGRKEDWTERGKIEGTSDTKGNMKTNKTKTSWITWD